MKIEPTTESIETKLEEITARRDAATPGPWHEREPNVLMGRNTVIDCGDPAIPHTLGAVAMTLNFANFMSFDEGQKQCDRQSRNDAAFIAHSWEDEGYLLALCRKRGEEIETRLAEVEHWVNRYNELDKWRAHQSVKLLELESEVARLKEMNGRWKAAIEGLTPNGSEYVDDPEACGAAIRHRTQWPQQIIEARAELTRLRKENAEVALTELREMPEIAAWTLSMAQDRRAEHFTIIVWPSDWELPECEFEGSTLAEAMSKVREFAAQQKGDSKAIEKQIDKCK